MARHFASPRSRSERAVRAKRVAALACVALAFGCQRVDAGAFEKEPRPPKPPSDGDDGLPPWFTGSESGDDETTGETVRPETGFQPTGTDGEGMCPKVDILFVIDNSFSMAAEQANLANSYAGFIEGIESSLESANDFHLGVVTTDAYANNPPGCQSLGDLVTGSPDGACGPYAAGPYMTADDDLAESFVCAAKVGTDGHPGERPLGAALGAIDPARSQAGACNEGFVRDDALLVLVLITDEDDGDADGGSSGSPDLWFDTLVEARGYETNAVVLSVIGVDPPHACGAEVADPGVRIADFTSRFTYSAIADVCEDDYAPFFNEALYLVYAACSGFTPPG